MSEAGDLTRRIVAFAERLDAGEVEPDEVDAVFDEVRQVAPAASAEDRLALSRGLDVLEAAVRRRMEHLGAELRQVGHARRAVTAFGALRGPSVGQRVRTRV